jgi:hypothetical protein
LTFTVDGFSAIVNMQISKSPIISGYATGEDLAEKNRRPSTIKLLAPAELNGKLSVSLGRTICRDRKSNYAPV